MAAMKKLEATLDVLTQSTPDEPRARGKLMKTRRGEVAEWLKAAVC